MAKQKLDAAAKQRLKKRRELKQRLEQRRNFIRRKLFQLNHPSLIQHGTPLVDHALLVLVRHLQACRKTGVEVENIDRVIIEAVEDFVQCQPETKKEFSVLHKQPILKEAAMRYPQYQSPDPRYA